MARLSPFHCYDEYIRVRKNSSRNNIDVIRIELLMKDSNLHIFHTDTIFFAIQGENIEISWGDELPYSPSWQSIENFDLPQTICHAYSWSGTTRYFIHIIGENIQTLSCDLISSHFIHGLDISECPNLTRLEIDGSNISSIYLSPCKKLKYLSCDRSELTELNLSSLESLEYFSCGFPLGQEEFSNKLKELDLSKCSNLKYLGCEYNCLSKINIQGCTKLENINCSYNYLNTQAIFNIINALPSGNSEKQITIEAPFDLTSLITSEEENLWQDCLNMISQKKWKINIKPHNKDRRHIIRQKFYPVIFTSSYDKYL